MFAVYLETVWVRCMARFRKFHKRERNSFYGFQHFAADTDLLIQLLLFSIKHK